MCLARCALYGGAHSHTMQPPPRKIGYNEFRADNIHLIISIVLYSAWPIMLKTSFICVYGMCVRPFGCSFRLSRMAHYKLKNEAFIMRKICINKDYHHHHSH